MTVENAPETQTTTPVPNIDIDEFNQVIGMTLADAIRESSLVTDQVQGWGDMTNTACALSAAAMTMNAKGYGLSS